MTEHQQPYTTHRDTGDECQPAIGLPAHLAGLPITHWPRADAEHERDAWRARYLASERELDIARRWSARWKAAAIRKRRGIGLILDHLIARVVGA